MSKAPCPICGKEIEPETVFTCKACWWKLPAQERVMLGTMYRHGQDSTAKLASVVRKYKEKHKDER